MALLNPTPIDWKAPDYVSIFRKRIDRLNAIRQPGYDLELLKRFYSVNIAQFINDWGVTVDPRAVGLGLPAVMPFTLFDRQVDWLEFVYRKWREQRPGITEKSRDMGVSWLAGAFSVSLCLFHRNIQIGFGSAKEDKVDRSGDPDSLFYKMRMFMQYLPPEFRGDWRMGKQSAHMRLMFPDTESAITGEAGDNIGRGGRAAIYFIDESAHIERPKMVDAALVATTECRQDLSSVNGTANSFAERRHSGAIEVFTFHYADDPRKGDEWRARKEAETDAVIWASEYEIDYSASVEGIVIPAIWASAAIDAHVKLGLTISGVKRGAFDVADGGADKCAFAARHGSLLYHAEEWTGKTSDIYASVEKAFTIADVQGVDGFDYDADGLGASVKGDARKINQGRGPKSQLRVGEYRGSSGVYDPERLVEGTQRTNLDFFENYKAQAWWALRFRFQATFNAVVKGHPFKPENIISIAKDFPQRAALVRELSQPVFETSKNGKVMVNKAPGDPKTRKATKSPNLADAVCMVFAPKRPPLAINAELLLELAGPAR